MGPKFRISTRHQGDASVAGMGHHAVHSQAAERPGDAKDHFLSIIS